MDSPNPMPKIRRMSFEDDTPFAGRWIRIHGITFHEWLTTKRVADAADLFAQRLVEWNFEDDDGRPLPADTDGVGRLDAAEARVLVDAWLTRAAEVPDSAPLEQPQQPDPEMEAKIHTLPSPAASMT